MIEYHYTEMSPAPLFALVNGEDVLIVVNPRLAPLPGQRFEMCAEALHELGVDQQIILPDVLPRQREMAEG